MSKVKEILEKYVKLVERKAQKAALTTAVAATTVLGLGVTSCGNAESSDNEPKSEKVTMTPEQRALIAQEEAQNLLREIEESGIPTVKKDKEGNVTEVLSSILEEVSSTQEEIVGVSYSEVTEIKKINPKFKDPEYMPVHQDAEVKKLGNGVEKHCRARDYETTVKTYEVVGNESIGEINIRKDEPYKVIDEHGDTLVRPKIVKTTRSMKRIEFKYNEKQATLENLSEQVQFVQHQKGRND